MSFLEQVRDTLNMTWDRSREDVLAEIRRLKTIEREQAAAKDAAKDAAKP